jgi:hypothetical protein
MKEKQEQKISGICNELYGIKLADDDVIMVLARSNGRYRKMIKGWSDSLTKMLTNVIKEDEILHKIILQALLDVEKSREKTITLLTGNTAVQITVKN